MTGGSDAPLNGVHLRLEHDAVAAWLGHTTKEVRFSGSVEVRARVSVSDQDSLPALVSCTHANRAATRSCLSQMMSIQLRATLSLHRDEEILKQRCGPW
jgi:hypothetical protein